MTPAQMELLQCPEHASPLAPGKDGRLAAACGCAYPVKDGIPRILGTLDPATRRTADGFQYQWERGVGGTAFDIVEEVREKGLFEDFLGRPDAWWAGKRVLDAGCGPGWFARHVASKGAEVIAVDLTEGVDIGARRSPDGNPAFVQADLTRLPFRDGTFDYVYCYCVIQHTRDTRLALRNLVRVARPGGTVAVTHYGPIRVLKTVYDGLRPLTARLPLGLLYALCHVAVPLSHVPLLRHLCYPSCSPSHSRRRRVLDTFDWYHAGHQRYTTRPELEGWCREVGLRDLEFGLRIGPTAVRGVK